MTPNKKIPSFCFESPWLKPFNLNMESVEVQGATRRMRVTWTPELAQDVNVFNNIDVFDSIVVFLGCNLQVAVPGLGEFLPGVTFPILLSNLLIYII